MLFDLGGEADVDAVLQKHAGMGRRKNVVRIRQGGGAAHRDVDDIGVTVQLFRESDALVDAVARVVTLRAADADLHREAGAAQAVDGVDDLDG